MLPKVRTVDEIRMLSDILSQRNLALPIWIQVETIDAVLNLSEIVDALSPGCALVLDAEDLAIEMGINHTPGRLGLLPVLSQLVLFGRKARLTIIDAVYSDLKNELGFRQSCEQAKNLGFDGKSLIHPAQLSTANQVFSPSLGEIEKAQQIIKAWQQKPAHLGVVSMDGQVIASLHVKHAQELLKKANQSKVNPGLD